jgi:hypothetical protein
MNPDVTLRHARQASQAELLDAVTVFREALESEAVEMMEAELARRGVGPDEIHAHHRELRHRVLRDAKGLPLRCCRCDRAAVAQRPGWHKLLGLIPVLPRIYPYCEAHVPK